MVFLSESGEVRWFGLERSPSFFCVDMENGKSKLIEMVTRRGEEASLHLVCFAPLLPDLPEGWDPGTGQRSTLVVGWD